MITQWIPWIQLFDFDIWHFPGQKHGAADKFSQWPHTAVNLEEVKGKENINDFILAKLNHLWVSPISLDEPTYILADNYSDYTQNIATYLTILRQPAEISTKEFNVFKKKTVKVKVQDNQLFCQNSKNVLKRQIVSNSTERQTIFQ